MITSPVCGLCDFARKGPSLPKGANEAVHWTPETANNRSTGETIRNAVGGHDTFEDSHTSSKATAAIQGCCWACGW